VPGGPRRFEGAVVLVAVLLGAAAMIGALFLFVRPGGEPDQAGSPDETAEEEVAGGSENQAEPSPAPETSAPETTDPPEDGSSAQPDQAPVQPSVCPADVPGEVCDAANFVEEFRGRPFKEFPDVEFENDDQFNARLLADFEEEGPHLVASGDLFRSLGMIDADADLVEAIRNTLEVGVVGFYQSDTGELVIRGTELNLYAQSVVVHELVHAHDDQWLDLDRPELEEAPDESSFGFIAVVEGNAVRIENAWRDSLTGEEQAELSRQELTFLSPQDLSILLAVPSIILELQFSPYVDGPKLVELLVAEAGGGQAGEQAVDDAITTPPAWAEEVLHPELYPNGDPTPIVQAPTARGEVVEEGVIGELLFDLWLGDRVGNGWGGDRYVTWREAGSGNGQDQLVCTAVNVLADSDDDLAEFREAAEIWARLNAANRSVAEIELDGRQAVLIEGCI